MTKILAVDNDLSALELYKTLFAGEGFQMQTAVDAPAAITRYQQTEPDIIILNVDMPDGGGVKVFERLKTGLGAPIPIIFSSDRPERLPQLLNRPNAVMLKRPVNADALSAGVKKLLADAADQGMAPPPPPPAGTEKTRILAVDDDLCLLEIYREIFSKAGFNIQTAEDATSAVTRFQEFKPALLILDVDMPAGGGQKVFDRMRNLFMDATPIIFSTGLPESVQGLAKNHNISVLKKPVNPEALIAEAKKMLKMI
ncbi:MAG: response regulator [Elusimicrobia bacterium]|nr:response regulator [Elusimicrobiota bacterium]